MNSGTSTKPHTNTGPASFQAWHLYLLLGMAAATVLVWRARDTQPAALLLLSAAAVAAGLAAIAVHATVLGFQGRSTLDREPIDAQTRRTLEQEKARVLRSIKELEFDRAMRKVSDDDFADLDARLRERALALMAQIDAAGVPDTAGGDSRTPPPPASCESCGTVNDVDARFCKACGQRLSA